MADCDFLVIDTSMHCLNGWCRIVIEVNSPMRVDARSCMNVFRTSDSNYYIGLRDALHCPTNSWAFLFRRPASISTRAFLCFWCYKFIIVWARAQKCATIAPAKLKSRCKQKSQITQKRYEIRKKNYYGPRIESRAALSENTLLLVTTQYLPWKGITWPQKCANCAIYPECGNARSPP